MDIEENIRFEEKLLIKLEVLYGRFDRSYKRKLAQIKALKMMLKPSPN